MQQIMKTSEISSIFCYCHKAMTEFLFSMKVPSPGHKNDKARKDFGPFFFPVIRVRLAKFVQGDCGLGLKDTY